MDSCTPLQLEFAPSRTRNLLVRIVSLPLEEPSVWVSAIESFRSSGSNVTISLAPESSHILNSLPIEHQSLVIVENEESVDTTRTDFAMGVASGSSIKKLTSFVAACQASRTPLYADLDSLDSNSLTALNSSPSPSPSLSPMNESLQPSLSPIEVNLDPYFVVPPKNAGFSETSFIPPPSIPTTTPGTLTIVGAGPGTPSLLTVAAITAIQSCTLLIVDRLVPADLIKYALTVQITPLSQQDWDLGSRSLPYILHTRKVLGNAPLAQQEIEDWTAAALKLGHSIVRLKGGDPFVYGRGGEELISAKKVVVLEGDEKNGIAPGMCKVSVVPGLSSSLVGPLMAGIPPTHRGVADQVLIATGRLEEEDKEVEWPLYAPNRTTVVLMAMGRIRRVVSGMTETAGYPLTPLDNGERVWTGILSEAVDAVKELGLKAHATLIVGRVVHALA
ncbi:tetrapyrrole methylase [Rhizoclosmatium globosum]|uniref:Tetrapyrrole methylase n=1 Tax=Rhizoclosmatium globosum TaxID=329046 RepID=A0A1Y2CC11_9FUNG|nr:tetrapyrrole methylase [Rhizoclosmatium globosum]|eukprot:ORY44466.1 tetrapyrrole methylase [Rhizoclosmatium globosum]